MNKRIIVAIISIIVIAAAAFYFLFRTNYIVTMETDVTHLNTIKHAIAQVIERDTDHKVKILPGNSNISIAHAAMESGKIDYNVNYTGTMYTTIYKNPVIPGINTYEEVLKQLKSDKIDISGKLGFYSNYALAVKKESDLTTLSDLATTRDLNIGVESDFYLRDLTPNFKYYKDTYGMTFSNEIVMSTDIVFIAMSTGEIQVGLVYTSDPRIEKTGLKALIDDKSIMPEYDGIVLYSEDLSDLSYIFNKFNGKITNEIITWMDTEVIINKRPYQDVARDLIVKLGV